MAAHGAGGTTGDAVVLRGKPLMDFTSVRGTIPDGYDKSARSSCQGANSSTFQYGKIARKHN